MKVWIPLALAGVLTALLGLALAKNWLPLGFASVWVWEYGPLGTPSRVAFPLIGLAAVGLAAWRLYVTSVRAAAPRARELLGLLYLCLAGWMLLLSYTLMHPLGFMQQAGLIINPASNSYYSTALQYPETLQLLREYHSTMPKLVSHAQTQSVGPVLWHGMMRRGPGALPGVSGLADTLMALSPGVTAEYLARQSARWWQVRVSTADAAAAMLIALLLPLGGMLSVFPLYYAGKWLHSAAAGATAAVLFVLMPAMASFTPSIDQLYPALSALLICLVLRCRQRPHQVYWWAAAGGLLLSLAVFMNMGLVTLLPLLLIFSLVLVRMDGTPWLAVIRPAFFAGLGFIIPLLALKLAWGYDLFAVYLASNEVRTALYTTRSYAASLLQNPLEFFIFCGLPVLIILGCGLWQLIKPSPELLPVRALLVAFSITLLALLLSGKTRGEVARMWMFFSPLVLLPVGVRLAWWSTRRPAPVVRATVLGLVFFQWLQSVLMVYYIRVWGY